MEITKTNQSEMHSTEPETNQTIDMTNVIDTTESGRIVQMDTNPSRLGSMILNQIIFDKKSGKKFACMTLSI
jgi:hypothetical protein